MTKKMKVIFTVSVLLNLLLAGTAGGMLYHKWRHSPWHEAGAELSPEARNVAARHFQEMHKEMKGTFDETRKAHKELSKILKAEEFDADAFEEVMQRKNAARQKMMEKKTEMMKRVAAELPPEERAKLGGWFMYGFGKGGRHKEGSQHERHHKDVPD